MNSPHRDMVKVLTLDEKEVCIVHIQSPCWVLDIKKAIADAVERLPVQRQSIRLLLDGPDVKDEVLIDDFDIWNGAKVYIKDLGPQISRRCVYLLEYLGPIFIYLFFSCRPSYIYSNDTTSLSTTAYLSLWCWMLHFSIRVNEIIFIHHFTHEYMPMRDLFKYCGYYWGFAAYIGYTINDPLFTSPPVLQVVLCLAAFTVCQMGNLSILVLLHDIRPLGTRIRKIPMPNQHLLTRLFDYVSCPKFTYEIGSWIAFSLMTWCYPAMIFTVIGALQMTLWATIKHRTYQKELRNYPKRSAIVPYLW